MQYMGGKTRQGKHIEEQLLKYKGDCTSYIEPFMGGGAIFARMAPHFPGAALGADVHPDLMMMWGALQDGWEPPAEVTREDWYRIKGEEPSALRGFVGFGCSFGGRWFEGYASNAEGRDFADVARRGVLKKSAAMREARFLTAPYTALEPGRGTLVYCDPPYAGTKPYSGTDAFDAEVFWTTVRRWADNGAMVLVSEYTAPEWAEEIWARTAMVSLERGRNVKAVERLFLVRPVSDPAPTVEETTTQGDDVNPDAEAELDEVQDQIDYERRVTYGEDKGPWFGAMYEGRCSVSECRIEEGDRIRADGTGGYECEDCGEPPSVAAMYSEPTEGAVTDALPNADWQAQAQAAARRHVQREAGIIAATAERVDAAQAKLTADEFLFEDPTATEDVKPVVSVSGQPKKVRRDHQNRYAVVLPGAAELERYKSSGKPVGRTRVTTFVKAASSTIKLGEWKARNVVIGAARRRDLLLKAQGLTHENDRDRLDAIVRELEETAGSKVGSDLGTYLHEFTEYMDAGLKTWRDAPEEFRRSLKQYKLALHAAGLEPITSLIERTTIIQEYGWVCGTFDRIFYHRPSGQYIIGDLKTAKTMDYGKNEIEAQLWSYAHGVNQNGIYDWNTDTWGPADAPWSDHAVVRNIKVSELVGVVIHMPVQGPLEGTVVLLWADLENGREHAELCHRNRSQPKGKMRPWGDGPSPLAPVQETASDSWRDWEVRRSITPVPVMEPWSWEDRFTSVTTSGEASELWRAAKAEGVSGLELQRLVGLAQQRLRELGVMG